jgi:hypothetical protein
VVSSPPSSKTASSCGDEPIAGQQVPQWDLEDFAKTAAVVEALNLHSDILPDLPPQ